MTYNEFYKAVAVELGFKDDIERNFGYNAPTVKELVAALKCKVKYWQTVSDDYKKLLTDNGILSQQKRQLLDDIEKLKQHLEHEKLVHKNDNFSHKDTIEMLEQKLDQYADKIQTMPEGFVQSSIEDSDRISKLKRENNNLKLEIEGWYKRNASIQELLNEQKQFNKDIVKENEELCKKVEELSVWKEASIKELGNQDNTIRHLKEMKNCFSQKYVNDLHEAFQRVAENLGMIGKFRNEFGYEQIIQKAMSTQEKYEAHITWNKELHEKLKTLQHDITNEHIPHVYQEVNDLFNYLNKQYDNVAEPCHDILGKLTQIDNMICGIVTDKICLEQWKDSAIKTITKQDDMLRTIKKALGV